jgi:hypothetical protein
MEAGHADVLVHDHGRAQQLGSNSRLVHNRPVGRAGRDDHDQPARVGSRAGEPDESGGLELLRVGLGDAHGRTRRVVSARDEHAPCARIDQGADDRDHLRRRLAFSEHGLGRALPQLPVPVHAREAEVENG